ncbi:Hypothetical protein Eab7_0023 [Exiguobacterium antarcticum B7]|nr:Hypothetical protein Eab7_0023 [Exiguobacterium antarcticum B7]
MFDLLVFVTKVTLTKLALHSLFVSEDTFFCLIVQFSKFVRACFGDSIRIPSLKQ